MGIFGIYREQTSGYCSYIKSNLTRICKLIADLEKETKTQIGEISALKRMKMSFKEKSAFRKMKEKTETNLKYLYLVRDFFTALAKNVSGLILSNEELMLVMKFAPFFDGVPVLDIYDDEDIDDSVSEAFKKVEKEVKDAFISAKKFDLDDYLYRYDEKIDEYIIPDIVSAVESFLNAIASQENLAEVAAPESPAATPEPTVATLVDPKEIECPNCHKVLSANARFCIECGRKIEIKKPDFCVKCGEPLVPGAKFCAFCGTKLL